MWIIDFGVTMPEAEAALYEAPFEYVREHVRPERIKNAGAAYAERWWLHVEPASGHAGVAQRPRVATSPRPDLAKHRLFVWLDRAHPARTASSSSFARDDDYTFGVLHSRVARGLGAGARDAARDASARYTPTTCFETFPFPDPTPEQRERVGEAARRLVELRDGWLNPPGLDPADLAKRTLTNLYNQRPTWLANAHADLDAAVFAAYGWPTDLPDADILERLLALNLDRAALEGDPDVERMAFRAALLSMPAGGADEDFAFGRDVPRPSEFA